MPKIVRMLKRKSSPISLIVTVLLCLSLHSFTVFAEEVVDVLIEDQSPETTTEPTETPAPEPELALESAPEPVEPAEAIEPKAEPEPAPEPAQDPEPAQEEKEEAEPKEAEKIEEEPENILNQEALKEAFDEPAQESEETLKELDEVFSEVELNTKSDSEPVEDVPVEIENIDELKEELEKLEEDSAPDESTLEEAEEEEPSETEELEAEPEVDAKTKPIELEAESEEEPAQEIKDESELEEETESEEVEQSGEKPAPTNTPTTDTTETSTSENKNILDKIFSTEGIKLKKPQEIVKAPEIPEEPKEKPKPLHSCAFKSFNVEIKDGQIITMPILLKKSASNKHYALKVGSLPEGITIEFSSNKTKFAAGEKSESRVARKFDDLHDKAVKKELVFEESTLEVKDKNIKSKEDTEKIDDREVVVEELSITSIVHRQEGSFNIPIIYGESDKNIDKSSFESDEVITTTCQFNLIVN